MPENQGLTNCMVQSYTHVNDNNNDNDNNNENNDNNNFNNNDNNNKLCQDAREQPV